MTRFAPGQSTMTVAEALARIEANVQPAVGTETVPLREALGRVLAEDVVSPLAVPPCDNSAMDGWAYLHSVRTDRPMPIAGRSAAGHPFPGRVPEGSAVRILTGAFMPDGADTVAMQEDCRVEGEAVAIPAGIRPGANVRLAGEDVAKGSTVLSRGARLRPQDVGIAAGVGRTGVLVHRRLRAAIFSTGDEIRDPGRELGPGCIFDTNRYTGRALLETLGAEVTDLGILPDRLDAVRAALAEAASGHDLIMTSGGVSVGDEDHVKPAVEAEGRLDFWKLAIKPGKPVALGEIRGVPFVGLPGNPVSVMVTFMVLARPLALRLMGATDTRVPRFPVEAAFSFSRKPGRREWLRARLARQDGRMVAEKYHSEGSGQLSSMVWSDGLVEIPEDRGEVAPGDVVDYIPYAEVLR